MATKIAAPMSWDIHVLLSRKNTFSTYLFHRFFKYILLPLGIDLQVLVINILNIFFLFLINYIKYVSLQIQCLQ